MYDAGHPKRVLCDSLRDGLGREAGEEFRMEGTHADVRQNHHNIVK